MNFQNKVRSNNGTKYERRNFQLVYSDYQINLRNWTIPFGRKFRAIRIWFMMKWFGKEGMIASSKQHLG